MSARELVKCLSESDCMKDLIYLSCFRPFNDDSGMCLWNPDLMQNYEMHKNMYLLKNKRKEMHRNICEQMFWFDHYKIGAIYVLTTGWKSIH